LFFPDFDVTENDIQFFDNNLRVERTNISKDNWKSYEDILSKYIKEKYFFKLPENNVFYHYIKPKYLQKILEKKKIRLYNLTKYLKNGDKQEYQYFLEQINILFPDYKKQIKSIKDNIFIFSMTLNNKSEEHWTGFGQACVKFKFKISNNKYGLFKISNVVYEQELRKLFCLKDILHDNKSINLKLFSYNFFSYFFKQSYYKWENEIRFIFDNVSNAVTRLHLKKKIDERCETYVSFPLKNEFFELEIEEIICGKDIDKKDYQELKEIACDQHIRIWKYN